MSPRSDLDQRLLRLQEAHQLRRLNPVAPLVRPWVRLGDRVLLDCCSNDYLGLSQHPRIKDAACEATQQWGVGSGGSRLVGGTHPLTSVLETRIAVLKNTPAALVFNSGYQANGGILSALVATHDTVFLDRFSHASQIEGTLATRARLVRYRHRDPADLRRRLAASPAGGQRFILTESVFSMDGTLAPLAELYDLAVAHDAWLVVDEAHATGVFGETRHSGVWEAMGLPHSDQVLLMGTFSKALGSFGGYVAGSQAVIETLIQSARGFVYSTALPPGVIAANQAALEVLAEETQPFQTLWQNVAHWNALCQTYGLPLSPAATPIIPVCLGSPEAALSASQALLTAGFYVQAIRPPSVPEGTARLRITLSAAHQPDHLEALARCLAKILKTLPAV